MIIVFSYRSGTLLVRRDSVLLLRAIIEVLMASSLLTTLPWETVLVMSCSGLKM